MTANRLPAGDVGFSNSVAPRAVGSGHQEHEARLYKCVAEREPLRNAPRSGANHSCVVMPMDVRLGLLG
eukprot:COSAG02_NODE_10236_length_1989_cov_3.931513_1_plen_69_part_00